MVGRGQQGWAHEYGDDRLILNLGRTWRTGPEPEYLAVWHTPEHGLERVAEWERIFSSGEADSIEKPFELAARIDRAGFYEALLEPVAGGGGPYYAEYFDHAPGVTRDDVRGLFADRQSRHGDLVLNLLIDRIGQLGPEPRGLAFWTLPSYGALDGVARDLDGMQAPIRLVTAGLYHDLGREIL